MSNLIPRRKIIPVQASRVEIPPEAPMQAPAAGPVPTVNYTQTNYYVQAPTAQPPPMQQQPAQPVVREVHHHHTTHVYHAPIRPKLGKGTSFLGSIGLVLGAMAAGAVFVPQLLWIAQPLAIAAACFAGFGLLIAMLFRHVYTGIPMMGLVVAAVAYGLYLKNSGQLPTQLPQVEFNIGPARK